MTEPLRTSLLPLHFVMLIQSKIWVVILLGLLAIARSILVLSPPSPLNLTPLVPLVRLVMYGWQLLMKSGPSRRIGNPTVFLVRSECSPQPWLVEVDFDIYFTLL